MDWLAAQTAGIGAGEDDLDVKRELAKLKQMSAHEVSEYLAAVEAEAQAITSELGSDASIRDGVVGVGGGEAQRGSAEAEPWLAQLPDSDYGDSDLDDRDDDAEYRAGGESVSAGFGGDDELYSSDSDFSDVDGIVEGNTAAADDDDDAHADGRAPGVPLSQVKIDESGAQGGEALPVGMRSFGADGAFGTALASGVAEAPAHTSADGSVDWAAMAQDITTNKRRLRVATDMAAQAATSVLDQPLRPAKPPPEERTVSLRHQRVSQLVQATLTDILMRRLARNRGLYPGGLPIAIVHVNLSSDLRVAVVEWTLPTPMHSRKAPRGMLSSAEDPTWVLHEDSDSDDDLLRAQAGGGPALRPASRMTSKHMTYDIPLDEVVHDPVFAKDIARAERRRAARYSGKSRGARRRAAEDAALATDHLSPAMARSVAAATRALDKSTGELRRLLAGRVYLKYVPELVFRRHTDVEEAFHVEEMFAEARRHR